MCEPSHYILRTDRDECLGYGLIECLPRSLSSLPHQVLYLREGLFYGVEVRRVRWHEHQVAAPNFYELPHPFRPVRPQPIEHHHLSFDEARCQNLLHVSLKHLLVGSPLYAHALAHPSFQSDGGDEGLVLASVSRNPAIRSLAFRRPRPEPIHGDRKAAFVDEHQPPCVETGGQPLPQPAFVLVALLCYGRLFLSGQEPGRRAMVRHIVALEIFTPKASSKASQCSSRVRSGLLSSWEGSHSASRSPFTAGGPGIGRSDITSLPPHLQPALYGGQRDAEDPTYLPARSMPRSRASNTLSLRSLEYAFMSGSIHEAPPSRNAL